MNSEFDKFESYTSKADSSFSQQLNIAAEEAMQLIRNAYGPFDKDEINFFKKRLSEGGEIKINSLQRMLAFNLFYKYFSDCQTIKCIGIDDYITLILAARKILEDNGMYLLGAIVSSKVVRLATRKSINKKELTKIENSELYEAIQNKWDSIQKIFRDRYTWKEHTFGITEQSHKLLEVKAKVIATDQDYFKRSGK